MTYDGNGYAILDVREHLIAAAGTLPPDDNRPSAAELAELEAWDAWARREAKRG